jgi:hypothetical protein
MKKFLILLTLVVGLLVLSTGAFAQFADVCSSCPEADIVGSVGPGQAGGNCSSFDYETTSTYQANSRGSGKYRAIFEICNCLNAGTSFVAGHRIGVRLTILVDGVAGQNGAYWSQPATADIQFGMFATQEETCAATAYARHFGTGMFYKTLADGKSGAVVATLSSGTTCAVPAARQATMIVTDPTAGYVITAADELSKLSRWWIDIPEIRIDPTVLHNGEKISVKIETLDQSTGGICPDCVATCECTIDVAKVCTYSPFFTTLTVASSAPNSGVSITVNPSDNSGQGIGTTPFTLTYINNTPVTLTAPSKASGYSFSSWTGCTSTSGETCNVTMDSAKAVTANFRPTYSLPWLLLLLGN